MPTHKLYSVAASTAAPPIPSPSNWTEWGLLGAFVFFILQKGWETFNKKEVAESQLIDKLVDSLRSNQSHLLEQIVAVSQQSHEDLRDMKLAIQELTRIEQENNKEMVRAISEIHAELAKLKDET